MTYKKVRNQGMQSNINKLGRADFNGADASTIAEFEAVTMNDSAEDVD